MPLYGPPFAVEEAEDVEIDPRERRIRNVVFMGMGEPLNNFDNVMKTIKFMTNPGRFGLATSKISLSTVGVLPYIKRLTQEAPEVRLALSLHAPNQDLRKKIVPSAGSYPIEKLLDAVDDHAARGKQQIMIEYVLLMNVNDEPEHAHEIGALLQNRNCMLNIIPWNATYNPRLAKQFRPPGMDRAIIFQKIVNEYKTPCTIRENLGADIDAACGQMAQDIEDMHGVGCGGAHSTQKKSTKARTTAISAATAIKKRTQDPVPPSPSLLDAASYSFLLCLARRNRINVRSLHANVKIK